MKGVGYVRKAIQTDHFKKKGGYMLKVSGNKIELTRGDTMILEVELKDEMGEIYTPTETDKIFFRLKRNATAKEMFVVKEIPYDTMILQLNEEDTENLKFGTYVYEIELVTSNDYHFTAIANEEFVISEELETHG